MLILHIPHSSFHIEKNLSDSRLTIGENFIQDSKRRYYSSTFFLEARTAVPSARTATAATATGIVASPVLTGVDVRPLLLLLPLLVPLFVPPLLLPLFV